MTNRTGHMELRRLGDFVIKSSDLAKFVCSPEALASTETSEIKQMIDALTGQLKLRQNKGEKT